jgi:hypothetical protein
MTRRGEPPLRASLAARLHGVPLVCARRRDVRAVAGVRPWVLVDLGPILERICAHAARGYCEPYKREVIGILLGRVRRSGAIACLAAIPYRTPFRTRTKCDPHPQALRRRTRALARAARLRPLGCYHSHPEEARSRAHALSAEDREIFLAEPDARIEVVVSVDRAGRTARVPRENPRANRDGSLSFWRDGFCYRISADAKIPGARPQRRRGGSHVGGA